MDARTVALRFRPVDPMSVKSNAERSEAAWENREVADPAEDRGRLKKLKRDIALNRYDVDADAVAGAILSKLQLVRRGRRALAASAADRSLRAVGQPRGR